MPRFPRAARSEDGITIVETVVAIGLMSVAIALVGSPMMSALQYREDWRASLTAVTTLQQANRAVSKDTANAHTISLADGAPPVNNMTLDWEDLATGANHTASYSVDSGMLLRTFDGNTHILARSLDFAEFSRSSNVLTFTLSVQAASGTTDQRTATYFLRSLQ